jgi:hypothetical protein
MKEMTEDYLYEFVTFLFHINPFAVRDSYIVLDMQGLRQEVIVDLVDQCRSYKQRAVQLVNSTS